MIIVGVAAAEASSNSPDARTGSGEEERGTRLMISRVVFRPPPPNRS